MRVRTSRATRRPLIGAMAAALLVAPLAAAPVEAQDPPYSDSPLRIRHDPVSCLEAGKHPRLLACFSPASRLARARVYFRAHGTTDWYYVSMAQDAPCFVGVLPKPTLEFGKVDYYVEATSREFAEVLTQEYDPIVVDDERECDGILAPFLDKAKVVVSSVSGATAVPQGFLSSGIVGAGVSSGLVAGVVGAGAAVAGIAVAGGESDPAGEPATQPPVANPPPAPAPTPTPTPEPGPTPTPGPGPTPTPTPAPTPTPNQPPNAAFNVGPTSGDSTLRVTFNMCGSTDPDGDTLQYSINFGDGQMSVGSACNVSHNYTAPEETTRFYSAVVCVTDGIAGHDVCQTFVIRVEGEDDFRESSGSHVGAVGRDPPRAAPAPSPSPASVLTHSESVLGLSSHLTVAGASGQIVLNGVESFFVGTEWSRLSASGRSGTNRVEALLVDGEGSPGEWRFELSAAGLKVDGFRVVAGQVVIVTSREVVFAIAGRPGERIVFSFEIAPTP